MQPGLFIIILVLQSERLVRVLVNPLILFSDDPRRCIRRTIRDCRGCRSSRVVCRCGRCGNRRGIELRLGCCCLYPSLRTLCRKGRCGRGRRRMFRCGRFGCFWLPECVRFCRRRNGAASLVGVLDQVASFVVGVAAVEYGTTKVV